MTKRRSLTAALKGVEPETQVEVKPAADEPASEAEPKLVGILLKVTADDHDRIRNLSFHSKVSLQQLGLEAWSLLLESKGLDPLAKAAATSPGRKKT